MCAELVHHTWEQAAYADSVLDEESQPEFGHQ